MRISCLLLAAGDSSRMLGKNKLTLEVEGKPVIKRTLEEIKKVSLEETVVVTGFQAERIKAILSGFDVSFAHNQNFLTGMHSSIRTGLRALKKECDAFFICLSDQPEFDHRNLLGLSAAFTMDRTKKIFAPVYEGKRGHPVLIASEFIPEIMAEPDGDYGCAYLFKRHADLVATIPVRSDAILRDLDSPKDYEDYLAKSKPRDPVAEFFAKTVEMRESGQRFSVATVIEVIGSASARTGSKAIFDHDGKNLLGWVGGGCAERFIGEESVKAIAEGKTRTVLADLDDEIFGLGVACGGKMRVFIDPILPSESMPLPLTEKFQNEVRTLSGFYGWTIESAKKSEEPETIEELLLAMTKTAAEKRGRSGRSLRIVKNVQARFMNSTKPQKKEVTIVGRTRITEALARHFNLLSYSVRAIGPDLRREDYPSNIECSCLEDSYDSIEFRDGEVVVIASHTAQDPQLVKKALDANASHVAMIGSLKRSDEVLTFLGWKEKEVSSPLFVPAGLDIDAKNPDEIALSVVAEVVSLTGAHQ